MTTREQLDNIAQASVKIEDAQALLDDIGSPLVIAHLQHALDLLRGEPRLLPGSRAALRIERRFARSAIRRRALRD